MTGNDLRATRQRLGLTQEAFGRALGYQATPAGLRTIVSRLETGLGAIPERVILKIEKLDREGWPRQGEKP